MGKIKKKGTTGSAKNFITRTQAVRKLQITLPDFRRLCIFKGIYPREPRNKKKASKSSTPSTTFYYTKDIQYLLHEPLLRKFREHKTLAKKISKALGRGEVSDAARLEKNHTPRLSLDHVIKERYPTFVDALRDLDDALSMLFLFANLPSTTTVPPKTIALCQRLCLEFQHYLITTSSLRKSFLSIKGIYYQATIQGQDILWLVPYRFVQRVTGDVDFRIMGTFVEFYSTLLGFVNFRLYTSIGLVYPPKFSQASDDRGGELRALTLEGRGIGAPAIQSSADTNGDIQKAITANGHTHATTKTNAGATEIDSVVRQIAAMDHEPTPEPTDSNRPEPTASDPDAELVPGDDNAIDTFTAPIASDGDVLPQPSASTETLSSLFTPLTVYLSRETPRQPLEFLLRAFGCKRIAWDPVLGDGSYTHDEHDPAITHQVVDRPVLPHDPATPDAAAIASRTIVPGRIYIQPQWVWDCANEGRLLRPDLYAPGAELPPHLSPWVKPTHGVYDPTAPLAEQELEGEAEEAEDEDPTPDDGSDHSPVDDTPEIDADDIDGGMDIAGSDSSSDSDADDRPSEWNGLSSPASHEDVDEDGEQDPTTLHQLELAAELTGAPLPSATASTKEAAEKAARRKAAAKKRKEKAEELERQKMMMSRKKRKVLDKMLYGNERKEEVARELRGKRRRLEGEKAK